jgi:hypothetical protein
MNNMNNNQQRQIWNKYQQYNTYWHRGVHLAELPTAYAHQQ